MDQFNDISNNEIEEPKKTPVFEYNDLEYGDNYPNPSQIEEGMEIEVINDNNNNSLLNNENNTNNDIDNNNNVSIYNSNNYENNKEEEFNGYQVNGLKTINEEDQLKQTKQIYSVNKDSRDEIEEKNNNENENENQKLIEYGKEEEKEEGIINKIEGGEGESEEDDLFAVPNKAHWRNLVGFFICGLLNNYSYVVMLSAAEKMIHGYTGLILLFDILPSLLIQLSGPFFLHYLPYNFRVFLVFLFSILSFQLVAWFDWIPIKLIGVCFASLASGGGEITYLAMTSYYNKLTVGAWSSGTGGAGVFGALSYLALTSWCGLSNKWTLIIITVFPFFLLFSTFILMTGNHSKRGFCSTGKGKLTKKYDIPFFTKIKHIIWPLSKFMIPLFLVYLGEYTINQAIVPNITFKKALIHKKDDYTYYQFLYQIGVFISRSSVSIFPIKRTWIPALLQCINVVILFCDAMFRINPTIWITFVFIIWEGLLGGSAYVNSFYRISIEIKKDYREFSLAATVFADAIGICSSAIISIFLQTWIKNNQKQAPF